MYKRGALADSGVIQWIADNAVAVMLDYGKAKNEIQKLGVSSFPTTVVLSGETVLESREGALSAADLLALLQKYKAG